MTPGEKMQCLFRERLLYIPETGKCFIRRRPRHHFKSDRACNAWNARHAYRECTATTKKNPSNTRYYILGIDHVRHQLHRVIWTMMTGEIPEQIDHIDGNGLNNAFSNLRNVSSHENRRNMRRQNGRDLPTGVFLAANGRFHAAVCVNNKKIHLGCFSTAAEAAECRRLANAKYGFHQNHGQVRPKHI